MHIEIKKRLLKINLSIQASCVTMLYTYILPFHHFSRHFVLRYFFKKYHWVSHDFFSIYRACRHIFRRSTLRDIGGTFSQRKSTYRPGRWKPVVVIWHTVKREETSKEKTWALAETKRSIAALQFSFVFLSICSTYSVSEAVVDFGCDYTPPLSVHLSMFISNTIKHYITMNSCSDRDKYTRLRNYANNHRGPQNDRIAAPARSSAQGKRSVSRNVRGCPHKPYVFQAAYMGNRRRHVDLALVSRDSCLATCKLAPIDAGIISVAFFQHRWSHPNQRSFQCRWSRKIQPEHSFAPNNCYLNCLIYLFIYCCNTLTW